MITIINRYNLFINKSLRLYLPAGDMAALQEINNPGFPQVTGCT